MHGKNFKDYAEIYTKIIKAGRRTYFFDVRETKAGDYFLTITESKKFTRSDGSTGFDKNVIHLYKEDFKDFKEQIDDVMSFIIDKKGETVISERHREFNQNQENNQESIENKPETGSYSYPDVSFDDI